MPPLTHSGTLLAPFQILFSAPTWRKAQRLIIGTLLACGRRTVAAALRHVGQRDAPAFSLYYQVFNRARWSNLRGSRCPCWRRPSRPAAAASPSQLTKRWNATLGQTHQQAWSLPRPAGFQPQAFRQNQRTTLDRADPGRHAAMDDALPGLTCPDAYQR